MPSTTTPTTTSTMTISSTSSTRPHTASNADDDEYDEYEDQQQQQQHHNHHNSSTRNKDNPECAAAAAAVVVSSTFSSVWIGRIMVLGAAAMYGSNFAVVKHLNESLPSGLTAALRFSFAALVVTVYTLIREQSQRHNTNHNNAGAAVTTAASRQEIILPRPYLATSSTSNTVTTTSQDENQQLDASLHQQQPPQQMFSSSSSLFWPSTLRGLEVGAWYCIGYISLTVALQTVEAGKCAFFSALSVVLVPLLDAIVKRVWPSRRAVVSMLCAVAGVGVLELGTTPTTTTSIGSSSIQLQTGDWLNLIMALTFAVGYWRLAGVVVQYPTMVNHVTMGQLLAVALGAIGYGIVEQYYFYYHHQNNIHYRSDEYRQNILTELARPMVLLQIAWSGLGPTALAVYLETLALQAITASELTLLMTSTSIWAAGFAYLVLGEVLSPLSMAGGGLILVGCVVYALGGGNSSSSSSTGREQQQAHDQQNDRVDHQDEENVSDGKSSLEDRSGNHWCALFLEDDDGGDGATNIQQQVTTTRMVTADDGTSSTSDYCPVYELL